MRRSLAASLLRRRAVRGIAAGVLTAVVLVPASAQAASKMPFSVQATSGGTVLSVRGTKEVGKGYGRYTKLQYTLRNGGGLVASGRLRGTASESDGPKPTVQLADVSGDHIPDAIISTFTGGAHCCSIGTFLVSTGDTWGTPYRVNFNSGFELKDLNVDGTSEIEGADPRFDYLFTSHAGSAQPITIQHAGPGALVDVAASFPTELRADADAWIGYFREMVAGEKESAFDRSVRHEGARAILAAAIADLARLGAYDEAKALVADAITRGDLKADKDSFYPSHLGKWLVKLGYLTSPAQAGLPN